MNTSTLFETLNPPQQEAVNAFEGAYLVLAGAGTGKTRVVTLRISRLLERGVPSQCILGVTFTNKAAQEMRERVNSITQSHVQICTFHSLGARVLRESIGALGYRRDFTIYDEDDTEKLVKACLDDIGASSTNSELRKIRGLISQAKNNGILPLAVENQANLTFDDLLFQKVYTRYQEKLRISEALDFDDLLLLMLRLFREHPDVLEIYQNRWPFLLVDEYQDTNGSQYAILKLLTAKSGNIFVVGDPDQSIYSWRGADIQNILNFERDFPGAKVIRLEQNYRSHMNILTAANWLISHNRDRYEKDLWSDLGAGEKIKYFVGDSDKEEADFVIQRIRHHHDTHDIPYRQMVVFYRTNAQSRIFEDYFLRWHIPYIILGGISFYQRREIKDILAFLRMVQTGADIISFERTINIPKRGFGKSTIEKIIDASEKEHKPLFEYCEALVDQTPLSHPVKINAKQKESLKEYVSLIRELRKIQQDCSLQILVEEVINNSRYMEYLKEDPDTFEDRKENLSSLVTKAMEWDMQEFDRPLSSFLEELALKSSLDEDDSNKDKVTLMTLHNGKGLEYSVAFLVGMEEELFPHINSRESFQGLEEERRLCYVGITRAKQFLYLSSVRMRFIWGHSRSQRPSRFISELPENSIEKIKRTFTSNAINLEPEPVVVHIEPTTEDELHEGDAVFHKDFGAGIVQEIYTGSAGVTYKVLFTRDQRERSIVGKYARLKKL